MSIITIPRKITKGEDLVVITRDEYEELLKFKKIYEFQPTSVQKKALITARTNRRRGKVLTLAELKRNVGLAN